MHLIDVARSEKCQLSIRATAYSPLLRHCTVYMWKTLFPSRAPARPHRPTGSPARRHVRAHPPLRRQHLSQSRPMLVARRLRRAHSAARLLAGARQRAKGRLANGNPMGRWNERVFAFRDFETGNGRRASRVVRIVTLQHPNGFRVARAQIAAETGVRVPLLPLTGVSHSTVTSATVGGKCTCTRASSFTRSGGFGTTFSADVDVSASSSRSSGCFSGAMRRSDAREARLLAN